MMILCRLPTGMDHDGVGVIWRRQVWHVWYTMNNFKFLPITPLTIFE